jgi:leucyl aminopeptidase
MTHFEIADLSADRLQGDVLAVPLFEDQRTLDGPVAVVDWRLDGSLSRMIAAGELSGRIGECLALQSNNKFAAPWVMVAGCGRWRSLDRESYTALVSRLLKIAAKAGISELALCLPPSDSVNIPELERITREALIGSSRLAVCRLSRIARFS